MPQTRKWHNGRIMASTALDRILVHVRRGSRVVKRAYAVNLCRVRELRPRDEGDDWEVRLEPPVNRVLPVARGELARLEAAFGEGTEG